MGDNRRPKTADWAPGTLEETRKAIGDIAPEEAKMMSKKLGGEVMYERSEPETMVIPAKSSRAGRIVRQNAAESVKKSSAEPTAIEHSRRRAQDELPVISQKFDAQIDKLMMSDEYKIKPNYGLFNFIKKFQKGGNEQLIPEFCTFTLKQHVESIQAFITVIKTMIQIAPASYKTKIASGIETKFKFLRSCKRFVLHSSTCRIQNPRIWFQTSFPLRRRCTGSLFKCTTTAKIKFRN